MKTFALLTTALVVSVNTVDAHSWLDCVKTIIRPSVLTHWRELSAASFGSGVRWSIDKIQWKCAGYPANKANHGDWITESSVYSYEINKYACHASQRTFGHQAPGRPMATVRPGQKIRLKYWGNGHSSYHIGSPLHRDPGLVRIYTTGRPGKSIILAKDLDERYWVRGAQQNFTADAIIFPEKKTVPTMDEKANYMVFTVPKRMKNGVYQFVWAWAWTRAMEDEGDGPSDPSVYNHAWANTLTTCFFMKVVGSSFKGKASPDILANKPGFNAGALSAKKHNKACSKTCYRGGILTQPCTGKKCPPCWYRKVDTINCYELVDGKCPWPNYVRCDGEKGSSSITTASTSLTTLSPKRKHYNGMKITTKKKKSKPSPSSKKCPSKCFRGGDTNNKCTGKDCPPCIYPNPQGEFVNCFEYEPGTKKCPFPGGRHCA